MRYDKRLGIVLFAILVAIAIGSSFYITPLSISDSDPSTYVIVPLLMLPLFAIFIAKNKIKPEVTRNDIVLGLLAFVLLALLATFLRYELSYLFISYRLDMLLFPVLIASLVILLFGSKNLGKFKWMMVYSVLACSLLMTPIIEANQGFSTFNTVVIYSVARVFIHNLSYTPPVTIAANGYLVAIGQTCVGIGILIAVVLFLLPIAYLYEGRRRMKALWVLSGVVLLFFLNTIRMFGIAMVWLAYGPSNAVSWIHIFAGIFLFYLTIIVLMLLAGRYGLGVGKGSRKVKQVASKNKEYYRFGIVAAVLVALAYFAFTYNYSSAVNVSQVYLNNNVQPSFNNKNVGPLAKSILNTAGLNLTYKVTGNTSAVVFVWGKEIGKTSPLLIYVTYPNGSINSLLSENNRLLGSIHTFDNKGLSGNMYEIESNATDFLVYNTGIPYTFTGETSASELNLYFVLPANEVGAANCSGDYNPFYIDLLNALNPGFYNNGLRATTLEGYCALDSLIA